MGSVKRLVVVMAGIALGLSLGAGCGSLPGAGGSEDPLEEPDFLTPIAQAQDAGVKVYWLGEEFQAGPRTFKITAGSEVSSRGSLELTYSAALEKGSVIFDVQSYAPETGEADAARKASLSIPGATSENVQINGRDGRVVLVPAGTRPVNQIRLFVALEDGIVGAQAFSGGPGIPGRDLNPLIDKDLLMRVVAENLRPYPE